MKKIFIIIIIIIALVLVYFASYIIGNKDYNYIDKDYNDNVNGSDGLNQESDGRNIRFLNINEDDIIISPLLIKGEAKGNWFFEGDFPIILTDWDGRIIAESFATAIGDWMVEGFVPFEGILEFVPPIGEEEFMKRGYLILQKDNPSDIVELDEAVEIRIQFE